MIDVKIDNGRVVGYLTPKEVAKNFGVKEATVRIWLTRNKIEVLKIGKETWIKEDIQYPVRKKRSRSKNM